MVEKRTERQKAYEDKCRVIADDLSRQVRALPMPESLLALGNIIDLFNCIRIAYGNGRADEKAGRL